MIVELVEQLDELRASSCIIRIGCKICHSRPFENIGNLGKADIHFMDNLIQIIHKQPHWTVARIKFYGTLNVLLHCVRLAVIAD